LLKGIVKFCGGYNYLQRNISILASILLIVIEDQPPIEKANEITETLFNLVQKVASDDYFQNRLFDEVKMVLAEEGIDLNGLKLTIEIKSELGITFTLEDRRKSVNFICEDPEKC